MDDITTRKTFMKLLNKYINDFKTNPEYYAAAREILNVTNDSKYIIDPQMMEYDNDNRKDTKEENALISSVRDIGKKMKRTGRKTTNYGNLYNELNYHPAFKKFFANNNINEDDMYNFAIYLLQDYQTKSTEQHEKYNARQKQRREAMKQENETLKEENQTLTEENRKKDGKIARRDRRLEKKKQQINDLTEQLDKNKEALNQIKEQCEQEKQRTINYYEKKTDEMIKQNEAEIAKLNKEKSKLKRKYETKGKVKLNEIEKSMDKTKYEEEKQKIIAKLNAEMKAEMIKEKKEYKEKIEQQNIRFEALKKSMEEAQRQSLQEIDNKLKEREEEIMNLNKQIEDERKQAEEDKRKIQADANRAKNEAVAKIKNKTEERKEKEILEEYQQNQKEAYGFTPNLEAYIKKKLQSKAYSLDEDELIDKIARDIGKPGGLPKGTDPKEVAKAIYNRGAEETLKHIKKIANLAILTGYNNDLYNKLPGNVAEEVQRYITEKINDDIRRKNIKYILPKDKPRWEHAMESKKLNPMLGRSAWRVN